MAEPDSHRLEHEPDIYREASRAVERDPDNEWPEYAKRKLPKKLLKIIAVIITVLILAGLGYLIFKPGSSKKPPAKTLASQPVPVNNVSSSNTLEYTASGNDLNLSFSYPSNWTVSPASGTDTTDKTITVNSPPTSIKSAGGTSITGKVTVAIRAGGSNINELNANNPVAALNSMQFGYSSPTASQQQYPYMTFVHFSNGSKTAGAFEEVIITSIQPFATGESVSAEDLSSLDPIISASFYRCGDTACSGQGAGILSITDSTWQNDEPFTAVQNILASLKLN